MPDGPDRMAADDFRDAYQAAKTDEFAKSAPAERPKAIILAGQPGAGKSLLTEQAEQELAQSGGSVIIDPDRLRIYHRRDGVSDYRAMAQEDYRTAASRVQDDASDMADQLRSDAILDRRNLIIDGTLKKPEDAESLCQALRGAGYEIDVRALSVSDQVSRRGVAWRLEYDLATPRNIPRDVPEDVQQRAYLGMPDSIARIEHAGLADRVSVYRRDEEAPFYTSIAPPGSGGDARAAIFAERNRAMKPAEKVEHAQQWDLIAERAAARHAPANEQARYQAERAAAHVQLRTDPAACAEYDAASTPGQTAASKGFYYASRAPPEAQLEIADDKDHLPAMG